MFFVQSPTARFNNGDGSADNSPENPSKEQAERHSDILKLAFRSGMESEYRVRSFELFCTHALLISLKLQEEPKLLSISKTI